MLERLNETDRNSEELLLKCLEILSPRFENTQGIIKEVNKIEVFIR